MLGTFEIDRVDGCNSSRGTIHRTTTYTTHTLTNTPNPPITPTTHRTPFSHRHRTSLMYHPLIRTQWS